MQRTCLETIGVDISMCFNFTQHLSWLVSRERDRSVCEMMWRRSYTLLTHKDCSAEINFHLSTENRILAK